MSLRKKLGLAVLFLVIALGAILILRPGVAPERPLPNPNGYDDFTNAAAMVSSKTSDWNTLPVEDLRILVAANRPALDLIRTGLTKGCRVAPYSLTATSGNTLPASNGNHLSELAGQKRAAQAFCAASRLALLDGRTNEAALLALDCVRYGNECSRGGVLIDGLVGIAIRAIGLARLEEALPGTDAATARQVASALEDVAARSEPIDAIFQREAQWARQGRFGRANFFVQLIRPFLQRGVMAKARQKFIRSTTDLRDAAMDAATRAYEIEHGGKPASPGALVPEYLKSVPPAPIPETTAQTR